MEVSMSAMGRHRPHAMRPERHMNAAAATPAFSTG
jgi:hypothetical protein